MGSFSPFLVAMYFYGIKDFYINKELYQIKYLMMTSEEKKQYKRFVYSICFAKDDLKDTIWEYLNNDENSKEKILHEYNKAINKYKG